jgi:hypothetical protein
MMPHLGVLSTVYPEASWQIFDKDCLVRLGTVVAPRGTAKEGREVMSVELEMQDGTVIKETMKFGDIKRIPVSEKEEVRAIIKPKGMFDVGIGEGKELESVLYGGIVGIVLDTRGRPLVLPEDEDARNRTLIRWWRSLDLYPDGFLEISMGDRT